jgi:Gas vesicle synthesis protein GvpL/GvpF
VIELYAITDDPTPPQPPLLAVRCDGLTALCAPAEPRQGEPTPDALWNHEQVVEGLMEGRDLLPVRFGTLVSDEDAAARAVMDRREELVATLDRVRGAVELAVRAHPRETDEAPVATTGIDYMRAKSRHMEAARLLHEPLASIARESRVRPGPELLRAAYLVDRDAVDRFVAMVRQLEEGHAELDLVCTGPWPPYSFAEQ